MAKAGLKPFGSTTLTAMDLDPLGNPFRPQTDVGIGALGGGLADMAALGDSLVNSSQFEMPDLNKPQVSGPQVLYSPATNKMFVNGALFDADDASSAIQSKDYLTQTPKLAPAGYDWQTVSPDTYAGYIKNIENPSLGNLAARNFEIGGSNLKLLAGRGMQFLGAEETGQDWVNEAVKELYYNQPYQREFTGIELGDESHGAIDWFVANLAQQGPMLFESIATALIGAGAGAVAGGGANPFTAVGGGVLALMGKESFKQSVLAAAKKYMKGQVLTNGEKKLLREAAGLTGAAQIKNPAAFYVGRSGVATKGKDFFDDALLAGATKASQAGRNQAIAGGAFLGTTTGAYGMGVADIYGEVRDTGVGDRGTALLGAIPYAALEVIPEFFLAGRILGVPNSALSPSGMAKGGIASRAGKGFAVGGTLEGLTELGQEAILLSSTNQLGDAETGKRLLNSFAAGFGVGGTIGTFANLRKGQPTDLLDNNNNPEPESTSDPVDPENPSPNPLTPYKGRDGVNPYVYEGQVLGPEVPPSPQALPAPVGGQALPAPTPAVEPVAAAPDFVAGQEGVRAGTPLDTQVQVNTPTIPAVEPGKQGLLNVFQDQPVTGTELQQRMEPTGNSNTVEQALQQQATEQTVDPNQQELPLDNPLTNVVRGTAQQQPEVQQTAMGQELLRAAQVAEQDAKIEAQTARQEAQLERERAQRQREFDMALQQRQQEQIQELQNARVEQILAENDRLTAENTQLKMPTVERTPLPPRQLSFPGMGVPFAQRALRRGAQAATPVETLPTTAELEQAGQLPLPFDEPVAPAATNLRRGQDAVQERSTEEVAPSEQTGDSETVRSRDTQEPETTTANRQAERLRATPTSEIQRQEAVSAEALRKGSQQQAAQPTDQTQQDRQPDSTEDNRVESLYASPYEAWEDMAIEGAVELDRLPEGQRRAFEAMVADGTVTYEKTKALYDEARANLELTNLEELQEAIAFFDETTSNGGTLEYAAQTIMDYAYFNTDSNLTKKTAGGQPSVQARAQAYINTTQFSAAQQQAMDEAFVAEANINDTLNGTAAGKDRGWVAYAAERNLFDRLESKLQRMPAWYKAKQPEVVAEPVAQETQEATREVAASEDTRTANERVKEIASLELEKQIDLQIRDEAIVQIKRQNSKEIKRLNRLYADADPEFRMGRGTKLKEYFNENGEIKLVRSGDGRFVPTTKTFTPQQLQERQKTIAAARLKAAEREREFLESIRSAEAAAADTRSIRDEDLFGQYDTKEDGSYFRADGEPITNPVPKGKIELIVKQVLKKLKAKPTVTVVKNAEDLRATNPKLYERAAASRPNGDFGQINAVGFSVGDQIIIFSDFAKTEQQVRFVVAHEALGHFGFRAFMPRDRMNAIFREIYRTDGHIRAVADRNIDRGMDMMEAVEEALADAAANLDISVVARFWNAVKNFMNRLGMTFPDDLARYFISQSRRNLRTGGRGVVSAQQLSINLKRLQRDSMFGRYSVEDDRADLASTLFSQFGMNKNAGPYGSFTGFAEMVKNRRGKDTVSDIANFVGESLERVQTLDNQASRNEGLAGVFKIFQAQSARVKRLHAEYAKITAFSHSPNWFGFGQGPTEAELNLAGEMLAYAALNKGKAVTEAMIRAAPNLAAVSADGKVAIDPNAFEQVKQAGEITQEEFDAGISYTLDVAPEGQDKSGTYRPDYTDVNRENVWRIYTEQREAVNQAALDILEANLGAARQQKNDALESFKNITGKAGNAPTSVEINILDRIIQEYTRLYKENAVAEGSGLRYNDESVANARRFIREINRALFEDRKLQDWQQGREDTQFYQDENFTDIIEGLQRLNALGLSSPQANQITNTIQNIYLLDVKNANSEFLAKRTIMGAYVPFTRRGKYQVMVKAVNSAGQDVKLDEAYKSSMPYFQVNNREEARTIQSQLNESFGDRTFKVLDNDGNEIDVKFVSDFGTARQSQPLTDTVNLSEFIDVLTRLDIGITPTERERLVVALTAQGERARRNLQRSGVAGWDTDVVRSVSEHLETSGHVAGKTYYRHRLNKIMLDNNMWRGDPAKLKRLEDAMLRAERVGTPEQIKTARQEYDAYAYQYRYSADVREGRTVNIYTGEGEVRKVKKVPTEGRGENYREEAKKLLAWYSDAANIDNSTEDILSGEVGSRLKLAAVLFQLGGSIATAAINAVSMVTHSVPYLATYNPKRGYGGGFNFSKSASAMTRAAYNMKNGKLAEFAYVNEVATSEELQQKHGLSPDEAEALRDATAEGVLQAAQFNALVGTARGGVNSNKTAAAIKGWMYFFSFTEQMNRRTTYLAAYRLERDRQLAAGASLADAQERASEFGRKAVNTSQGEYAMYNRPEMARGNLLQYIFMYKQFVIVSVQLMKGMNYKGRLYFLGMLLLMSGVKGIPFADDLMDLVDTLAQKFGIKMASVEKELGQLSDALIPGSSPYVMRGILDRFTGATISTRLGFGDLIPLTGVFKAGADPWREAENFVGPVYNGIQGAVLTSGALAKYGAEVIGLKDDTTRFVDIVRDSPISALRGVADGFTYLSDGRITNSKGSVISNDVPLHVALVRMMGFYPSIATVSNDIVRMNKFTDAYVKSMKMNYTQAYVKARLNNDFSEVNRIIQMVNEHNREHRGTEFEFRNFIRSANRSYNMNKKPTVLRYRKTAPKNIRGEVDEMLEIMGIDPNDL